MRCAEVQAEMRIPGGLSGKVWSRRSPSVLVMRPSDHPASRSVRTIAGTHRALTVGLAGTTPPNALHRPILAVAVKTLVSNVKQYLRTRFASRTPEPLRSCQADRDGLGRFLPATGLVGAPTLYTNALGCAGHRELQANR